MNHRPAKFTKPEAWPKAWGAPRFTEGMGGEFIWQSGGQEPPSPTSAAKAMEVKRLWRSRRGGMPEVRCPKSEVRGHFDRIYRMFRIVRSTNNQRPTTNNLGAPQRGTEIHRERGETEVGGPRSEVLKNSRATDFADGKQPENESGNQERGEQPNYPQRGSGNEPKPFRCQNLCR